MMKMMKIKFLLLIVVIMTFSIFCGYHLRGTGSSLPSYIQKIYIPEFENKTSRMELGKIITEEIISAFVSRGNFALAKAEENADAVLRGKIVSFSVVPVSIEETGSTRYKVRVRVKVELVDLRENKVLYKNPSFYYEDEYDTIEGGDFLSMETETIRKIAEEMSVSLINTILEGF